MLKFGEFLIFLEIPVFFDREPSWRDESSLDFERSFVLSCRWAIRKFSKLQFLANCRGNSHLRRISGEIRSELIRCEELDFSEKVQLSDFSQLLPPVDYYGHEFRLLWIFSMGKVATFRRPG